MINRRAGLSAVVKGVTPKDAFQPVSSAFWGAGEYPSHCRRICGALSTKVCFLFGRRIRAVFSFEKR